MTILLTHNNETKAITGACDAEFADEIMNQAKWVTDYMSAKNENVSYNEIKRAVPTLSAIPDIRRIQYVLNTDKDLSAKFVSICNIIAKASIFSISPCETFTI